MFAHCVISQDDSRASFLLMGFLLLCIGIAALSLGKDSGTKWDMSSVSNQRYGYPKCDTWLALLHQTLSSNLNP